MYEYCKFIDSQDSDADCIYLTLLEVYLSADKSAPRIVQKALHMLQATTSTWAGQRCWRC